MSEIRKINMITVKFKIAKMKQQYLTTYKNYKNPSN